jgi:hypothetical protein
MATNLPRKSHSGRLLYDAAAENAPFPEIDFKNERGRKGRLSMSDLRMARRIVVGISADRKDND